MAFNVRMGISSDSWYHLRISQKFAETWEFHRMAQILTNGEILTYSIFIFLDKWKNFEFKLILFQFNEVILLRLINILYSLGSVIGVYLLSKEFFKKKWLQVLPTVLLTNTLMFLFLSSSINYDNLGNMFSVFALLFFERSLKHTGDIKNVLLMILLLCLGTLTKYTIMPLALF
jgi:hypothetical protein